ncbi:WD40 repeat-like protein [Cylindrobasidium torrendii FP15055 ss-10]|uniref:WD40 repeat-like protein n=1 Tax=Cylindrobasidium torrendii FP15055 ss-10 TaxID=1314674 RepID=A0A0D7BUN6_9AGAR|nr:WD40 repeat-like protein [Cylindrobasidium torrendii FP15055 ss-10]
MPAPVGVKQRPKFHTGLYESDSDSDTESIRHGSQSRPHGEAQGARRQEPSVDAATAPIPYWFAKRHLTCGNPTPQPAWSSRLIPWRNSTLGKLKTANAALILCLNLEVDPPDIVKTQPCAALECWVDPRQLPANRALDAIGANLKSQYEGLSLKIQYKPILDPSQDDIRRCCQQLRRQARDDAVLFHFNGHGVPKPTASGELWCFNRNYTQYIPVGLYEIQTWLGSPGVYIWDCSAAGNLVQNFNIIAERRDTDVNLHRGGYPPESAPFMHSIQLAACAANENLPSCPDLPADVFTSCLTSPIDMALRYFAINNKNLPDGVDRDMIMQLPGDLKDRRTPLGELNWIFISITDTIAWTSFSRDIFARLYRSDLLVASLFRNFLLAERVLKNYNCTPHTYPPLPATNTHHLWATWDLAVDACLRQLPHLLRNKISPKIRNPSVSVQDENEILPGRIGATRRSSQEDLSQSPPYVYVPNRFFTDQLTAFEVWISRGGAALTRPGPRSLPINNDIYFEDESAPKHSPLTYGIQDNLVPRQPPEQLPIVLQVLLSQPHRLRALILLSQFVDLGPWAVNLVLSIGIFPYMAKLLQAAGQDLRPVLIFIWTRIFAVDPTVQTELYNNQQGYKYFTKILAMPDDGLLPNSSEHQAMCCFILGSLSRDFANGQVACLNENVFDSCLIKLDDPDFLLRQWAALCMAQVWDGNDQAKTEAFTRAANEKLLDLLNDESVEVRCAALFALQTFLGASGSVDVNKRGGGGSGTLMGLFEQDEHIHMRLEVSMVTRATYSLRDDASPMARKELVVLISCLVREWRGHFIICAWLYWEEDRRWRQGYDPNEIDVTEEALFEWEQTLEGHGRLEEGRVMLQSFYTIWLVLLDMAIDPYPEVAVLAQTIVDYVMALLLESPFSSLESATLKQPPAQSTTGGRAPIEPPKPRTRVGSNLSNGSIPPSSPKPPRPGFTRSDTMSTLSTVTESVSNTIKRTSSFANALKSLAGGVAFPSADTDGVASLFTSPSKPEFSEQARPPPPNFNRAEYISPYPPQQRKSNGFQTGPPPKRNGHDSSSISSFDSDRTRSMFAPSNVMEALVDEDMIRLRRREEGGRVGPDEMSPSPSGSDYSAHSMLGLGTGHAMNDVLPLKSSYFDWCIEYFTEPQMRQTEADEPGSIQYNHQVWRQRRNEHVEHEVRSQAEAAPYLPWDRPVTTLHTVGHPMTMAFHSYDKHLFIANEHDTVSVWDWSLKRKVVQFSNGNSRGTSVTSMHIINQDVGGILLTASDDGCIRLFRNYDPSMEQGPIQLVSAFRGLPELILMKRGAGIVTDWRGSNGTLLVGGDSRVIKSWDAQTESQGPDVETLSDSPVTAISAGRQSYSDTFVAGFADGVVKLFDLRLDAEEPVVNAFPGHSSWVQNIKPHPSHSMQFLSAGSQDGIVKLWDMRNSQSPIEAWTLSQTGLSAFDVHRNTEVFAGSSAITATQWKDQKVGIQSMKRREVNSSVTISTGQLHQPPRAPASPFAHRLTSLVFHPTEMLYGVGEPDGTVRIMGCNLASEPKLHSGMDK